MCCSLPLNIEQCHMTSAVAGAHRCQFIKTGKQLIKCHDKFLRRALGRQTGEALDVRKQDAAWDYTQ